MKRLYSILFLYYYVAAVKINKDTEQHIEKCIEIHEADTKGKLSKHMHVPVHDNI